MDILHLGPQVPMELAKDAIGHGVALMGNLDPLRVMLRGSREEFEAECLRIMNASKPGGGFVFSTGGELSPGTDPERVRAMSRYARTLGGYAA